MWDMVKTIIPSEQTASDDRIPTISEIRKLVEYPDRRIKTIVLVMLSSGIRLGAWDYLKWKHVIPIYNNNNNDDNNNFIAAKIIVYAGQDEEYFSLITPEAYHSLKEWMDFRASYGENITPESWLMRNTWKKVNVTQGSRRAGLAKKPIKFKSSGIRILMGRAWNIQNVRGILEEGEKRHEFKSTHGFRKFFKSNCEQAMKSLHVEMLMGHNTGLARNYYRPNENEILSEYLKAIPYLTINDEYRLSKQVQELKEQDDYQKYVIDKKIKEKDEEIEQMQEQIKKLNEIQKDKVTINKNEISELKEALTLLAKSVGFDIDEFKRKHGYK
jgi:integrase